MSHGNGDIADIDSKSAIYGRNLHIILSCSRMQELYGIAAICVHFEPDPLFFP